MKGELVIKIRYISLILIALILMGCGGEEYTNKVVDDIQIEMSKEFDVPISDVQVKEVKHDSWRFTVDKFLINVEGDEKTYMYLGNDFNGYELLIYDEQ